MSFFAKRKRRIIQYLAATLAIMPAQESFAASPDKVAPSFAVTPSERMHRSEVLAASITKSYAERTKKWSQPNAPQTVRDVTNAALFVAVNNNDLKKAQELMKAGLSSQNMTKGAPNYGELPWQTKNDDIKDANAIEFGTQAIGPLLAKYGKQLPADFKTWLSPHLGASIAALRRHSVPVSYTNIYLMKLTNLILIGEAAGDQAAVAEGYSMLDQFIKYTSANGIHEYDSPTYYSTDLGSLEMGNLFAAKPEGRKKFKKCLDYFWSDIAANYFPEHGSLSGPHSRDYDFLSGTGGININLYMEGLRSDFNPKDDDLEKVYPLIGQAADGYHPSIEILQLSESPERVVLQRWDTASSKDRYNFITKSFSIGSANGDYGPQDKSINIQLGDAKLPDVTVVADAADSPFGKVKQKDKSGHSKPTHLPTRPLMVQHRGNLLAMLDLDASANANASTLSTNILLPAGVHELALDGEKMGAVDGFKAAIARRSTAISLISGDTVLAIKIFAADGCGGQGAQLMLTANDESYRYGVLRLAIYHHQGGPAHLTEKNVRVGILFCARSFPNEAKAHEFIKAFMATKVASNKEGNTWTASVNIDNDTLEGTYDLANHRATLRKANGNTVSLPVFAVNGNDVQITAN